MKRFLPILFLGFLFLFLFLPTLILDSAKEAISTWAEFVLPALLPFFILNRLCVSYGAIDLMGKLLAPFTEKIMKLPRETAYIIATGYTTGAPVSSMTVAHLRENGFLDKRTGDFLLPFTSNVSPLFLFSVVAAGFLGRPDLGAALALIHYGTNFILGFLCFRFLVPNHSISQKTTSYYSDYPPLGQGISDSIIGGISTITLICGIMILFFILIDLAEYFHLFQIIPFEGFQPLFSGGIEITAGIKCTAAMDRSLWGKLPLISGILAFGGISAMLQIATQIKGTDLSLKTYTIYKAVQAVMAVIVTLLYPFEEQVSAFPLSGQESLSHTLYFTLLFLYGFLVLAGTFIPHPRRKKSRRRRSFSR